MAHLGTLTVRGRPPQIARELVTDYNINQGRYLGALTVRDGKTKLPARITTVNDYVVRQLTVVYRQLWPSHGQRFPQ